MFWVKAASRGFDSRWPIPPGTYLAQAILACASYRPEKHYMRAPVRNTAQSAARSTGCSIPLHLHTCLRVKYLLRQCWEYRFIATDIRAGQPGESYPRYIGGERKGNCQRTAGSSHDFTFNTAHGPLPKLGRVLAGSTCSVHNSRWPINTRYDVRASHGRLISRCGHDLVRS